MRRRHPDTWPAAAASAVRSLPKPQPPTPSSAGQPGPRSKPRSAASRAYSSAPSPICRLQTLRTGMSGDTLALQSGGADEKLDLFMPQVRGSLGIRED